MFWAPQPAGTAPALIWAGLWPCKVPCAPTLVLSHTWAEHSRQQVLAEIHRKAALPLRLCQHAQRAGHGASPAFPSHASDHLRLSHRTIQDQTWWNGYTALIQTQKIRIKNGETLSVIWWQPATYHSQNEWQDEAGITDGIVCWHAGHNVEKPSAKPSLNGSAPHFCAPPAPNARQQILHPQNHFLSRNKNQISSNIM